jgi:TRAP-type transport system periplasmic protein
MTIHVSTPEEKQMFRDLTQEPVMEFIVEQVGQDLVDRMMAAVDAAEAKLYGSE